MVQNIIVIKIDDVEYKVKTAISMGALHLILSEDDSDKAFEKRVADAILYTIISENNEDKPSIEKVLEYGNRVYEQYISAVISSNEKFSIYYTRRPETESICERFCKSLNDYWREISAEFSNQIATMFAQTYHQPISEMLKSIGEMVTKSCEPALAFSKQFSDVLQRTRQMTTSIIKQSIVPVFESIANMQESTFRELAKAAKVWNEIDWNALKDSYRKWGEYGWTLIGDAPLSLYANEPESQQDADRQALRFFTKKKIEILFNELQRFNINKKDLKSAFFCFNSRQYKACAMILCAMIEAPLIKIQPIAQQHRRKVGKGAVKRFNDETAVAITIEDSKLLYLHIANVLGFLIMLFDDANDFRLEPKHLNRNFINHGMARRDVRRKDCVKLFLGLNNIMEMLELLDK